MLYIITMVNLIYVVYISMLGVGLCGVITSRNLVKKLLALNIMQTAVILLYIAVSYKSGEQYSVPLYGQDSLFYVNPVSHVLMLTAIVVGFAIMSVGLAIAIKIKQHFRNIDEMNINYHDKF